MRKCFAEKEVLKGIDLVVPEQSVFGFLGNNGAGKTTLIKSLLGLLKYTGEIRIFGHLISDNNTNYRNQIGALVESPSVYSHLTAGEYLTIPQKIKKLSKSAIDEVLEVVGLSDEKDNKIEHFSLGMKQRIALALALIGKPKLLILDEPTNGLDPRGIVEIRELISSIPEQTGATVFLSSHLLDEIEKTVTHVAILRNGKIGLQSELRELLAMKDQRLTIRTPELAKLENLLLNQNWQSEISSETVSVSISNEDDAITIHQLMAKNNIPLIESRLSNNNLEQLFHAHND